MTNLQHIVFTDNGSWRMNIGSPDTMKALRQSMQQFKPSEETPREEDWGFGVEEDWD